ncbi:LysR family transcriptional regulator [Actinomadura rugatobispora]|uniref:LysR family transcriptional regulator n=1 Tax=Actinomadura rugatobispora TaxID=1994 RepID=A0ABW0ZMP0_9ACTN|nr:LysR family transcriptional regulator [Actinomadura rugatobispora]
MDLDLAIVRAFVIAADHLHFGQAAKELSLTQQALSARISRLERSLGVRLFDRSARGVDLTAAGRLFLASARHLLIAGDRAVASVHLGDRPLRMGVWGDLFFPGPAIRALTGGQPDLRLEVGTSQHARAAVAALRQDELDVAFGRVAERDELSTGALSRCLVRLDAMGVLVHADHPLGSRTAVRPVDLRGTRLWFPGRLRPTDFLHQLIDHFGLVGESDGVNLGPYHLLHLIPDDPGLAAIVPCHVKPLVGPALRLIPLTDPTPLYGSSLVWRKDEPHPDFERLLQRAAAAGQRHAWLRYDEHRHWLPAEELADVSSTKSRTTCAT